MKKIIVTMGYKGIAQLSVALVVGIMIGFFVRSGTKNSAESSGVQKIQANTSYAFIRPLLAVDVDIASKPREYIQMQSRVQKIIDNAKGGGDAERVSFYFRDLEHITSVGIDENESYDPASLIKLPIMMAYFKKAEGNPGVLNEKISYQSDPNNDAAAASSTIKPNDPRSVADLITIMIRDSDNVAKNLLLDAGFLGKTGLEDVFNDLDIAAPSDYSKSYFISAKNYALFFRVLYNATYLSRDMSERALDLLSKTTFNDGLAAGVPQGTVVAHKYGEYGIYAEEELVGLELHDCGIVYYPGNPYLVCVMTKGKNLATLERIIKNISSAAYSAVSARYPEN